jgi:hypothetical protein
MADVIITPASGLIDFQNTSGISSATIQLNGSGDLIIGAAAGDIQIGDTSSDIFVGDGANNVDIVFEQDGEIRGDTGVTVTLGQSDSYIKIAGGLKDSNNQVGTASSLLLSTGSGVKWESIATLTGIVTSIVAGTNITVSGSTGQVTINSTASGGGGSQTLDTTLGLGNTSSLGMSVGVVTATSFSGSGTNLTGIVTSIVAGTNVTISSSTGQVTINSTASGGGGATTPLDILEVMLFA